MPSLKIFISRIAIIAVLVLAWTFVDRGLKDYAVPGQSWAFERSSALSGSDNTLAAPEFHFVRGFEALRIFPRDTVGIFLYNEKNARFYPLDLLARFKILEDNFGAGKMKIVFDSVGQNVQVLDARGQKVDFWLLDLEQALYQNPAVEVVVKDKS